MDTTIIETINFEDFKSLCCEPTVDTDNVVTPTTTSTPIPSTTATPETATTSPATAMSQSLSDELLKTFVTPRRVKKVRLALEETEPHRCADDY